MSSSSGQYGAKRFAVKHDEGYAVAAVLVFLLVASAMVIPFTLSARSHYQRSFNVVIDQLEKQSMINLVRLGAEIEVLRQSAAGSAERYPLVCRIEAEDNEAIFEVEFTNHSGLIDLNASGLELLRLGFTALEFGESDAAYMAKRVIDYRSPNSPKVWQEESYDVRFDVIGGAKRGLIEAVEELYDFSLMGSLERHKLHEVFTVYSRSGTLDKGVVTPVLASVIEVTSDREPPFLVAGSRRTPAFTVRISRIEGGSNTLSAYGVFGSDRTDPPARQFLPIWFSFENREFNLTSTDSTCSSTWTEENLSIARGLIH